MGSNYLIVNTVYGDPTDPAELYPNSVGLSEYWVAGRSVLAHTLFYTVTWYDYYLLRDISEEDAILYALRGITLIKISDVAHEFKVIGHCQVYYNIPLEILS